MKSHVGVCDRVGARWPACGCLDALEPADARRWTVRSCADGTQLVFRNRSKRRSNYLWRVSDNAASPALLPVLSIRDLVHSRLSAGDRWDLALVQRDEKWDPVRMRHLLDSALAGYPIGAILLCKVHQPSEVIVREGGKRVVREARPDEWQLLDGQQRINAFYSMLTDRGTYGRFYLHMTMVRQEPGPAQSRKTKDRLLSYISWTPPDATIEIADRALHLDLSLWTTWADKQPEDLSINGENAVALLREIDPGFEAFVSSSAPEAVVERLSALWSAWKTPRIPALYAEVRSPNDVLEIFTRVNLGGVNVVGTDVFFAAVKTYWGDAEERLSRVLQATPFLTSRLAALRLMARLASRATSPNDLTPLRVDRLAGPKPHPLITAMHELTADDSVVLRRITDFSAWYRDRSQLGYALRLVHPDLWDEVLGWAAAFDAGVGEYEESLDLLDSYLLGATLFRYTTVMRDPYKNTAFLESLSAGKAGSPFPTERILGVARSGGALRGSGGSKVATLVEAAVRQSSSWADGQLLTALAQRIPFDPDRSFDWDHIFPQAQAHRMWTAGKRNRRHHPGRRFVNAAGNFWALNYSANRSLKDLPGAEKFRRLFEWLESDRGHEVWPRDRWSLTDDEINAHIEVDRLLDGDPANIASAMDIFEEIVNGRTQRLWDEALDRFPMVGDFAADSSVLGSDGSAVELFWAVLGIRSPPAPAAHVLSSNADDSIDFGKRWAGRERWLNWLVDEVAKKAKVKPGWRNRASTASDGFDKGWWISTGEPESGTQLGFGMAASRSRDGERPLWAQVNSRTPGWAMVEARILASGLGEVAIEIDQADPSRRAIWIPLSTPADLAYTETEARVLSELSRVRDIVIGEALRSE